MNRAPALGCAGALVFPKWGEGTSSGSWHATACSRGRRSSAAARPGWTCRTTRRRSRRLGWKPDGAPRRSPLKTFERPRPLLSLSSSSRLLPSDVGLDIKLVGSFPQFEDREYEHAEDEYARKHETCHYRDWVGQHRALLPLLSMLEITSRRII